MSSIRVVAGIAVSGRRVLIARRSPSKSLAGLWEFPGGKVEGNENDETALKREIKEEFNRDITIGEKFCENSHTESEKTINLVSYFMSFTEFPKESNAHDQIKWSSIEDLTNYEFCPADKPIVNKLLNSLS